MRRILVCAAAAALMIATAAPARADVSLGERRDTWPSEITKRPLTLGAGMIEIWAPLQLNASKDADWKPVTSNPSLGIGITDEWMIGVRHIIGLCFGGASNGCSNVYNDVGAFTRISILRGGGVDVAIQGAVDASPFREPRGWDAQAGLLLRFGGGALAVTAAPSVSFGPKDRDSRPSRPQLIQWNLGTYDFPVAESTFGNKEHLSTPVTVQLQLGPALALAVGGSLEGPLNPRAGSFGDYYRIPLGAALVLTPIRWIDVGASFTMPAFGGKNDTRDVRFLTAFVAFRI